MPRPPRFLLSHSYYHIIVRGNNRHRVFKSNLDCQYYLELVTRFKIEHPFDLYHYCLMPNHVHLLVNTKSAEDFSRFMKKLNLAYFYHFKRYYVWVGHFWQGRFKSQPVGKDEYFIQCGKYIELNPVRAGITEKPEDYHYSSYHHYARGVKDSLITEDIFYQDLGSSIAERQKSYEDLLISDIVKENYVKRIWASKLQANSESVKINYHLKHYLKY